MGNSVSAHIYETKVFRPYPVILYRLRLDPSIHWWKKIVVPRNNQIWRTRPNPHLKSMENSVSAHIYETKGKATVSLGTTKFGVLGKATVCMTKSPSKINGK